MSKLSRSQASKLLLGKVTDQPILGGIGGPTYDLYGAGDRDRNLYTWGSMGQISSMGLGLAVARPELTVIVLDGDGSILMNLGSLATIARKGPPNLVHIVWDDQVYETTGRQPTHTATGTDLAGVARAAGIPKALAVDDEADFVAAIDRALAEPGPWFIAAKIVPEKATARPPRDPLFFKYRFMRAIDKTSCQRMPPGEIMMTGRRVET
jgi:thiamine pyrophosphate-dependent acetolactate synthase large subunit-like protein